MQKICCMILLSGLLTSCASYYSSNGEKKYLQSRNGPTLSIPAPLTRENISDFYVLPEQTQKPGSVSVAPPQD